MTVKPDSAELEFDIDNWEPVVYGPTWTVTEDGTYALPKYTLAWELAEWCARWLKIEDKETGEELPFTFTPEQLRFLCWFYAIDETGRFLYSRAMFQRMKGPIADTELVATPGGWKRHGDLEIGDQVFAIDGTPTDVVALPFAGVEPAYRITFNDGTTADAAASHRWDVDEFTGRGRERVTLTTQEMVDKGVKFERPLTKGKTKATSGGVNRFRALCTPELQGLEEDLGIDPYILGYWLGDGDKSQPGITCGSQDMPQLLEQLRLAGIEHNEPYHTHGETYFIRFGKGWARQALRDLGVLGDKHIPVKALRMSAAQRWALLQGLMDSDGSIHTDGRCELSLSDEVLAGDAFELIRSLGLAPRRNVNPSSLNGRRYKDRHRIGFTPQPGEMPFRLPRKAERVKKPGAAKHKVPFSRSRTIVSIEPIGEVPVKCITVAHPSHQYLVGEGMVPTHNSGKDMIAAVLALFEAAGPCRLDYIDEDGEVHGRRIKDAYIQLAGVTQDQSRNTSDFFHTLLTKEAIEEFNFNIGKEVSYAFGGMVQIWLLTANPKAAEGKRPTFVVLNEVQWWLQANKGVEQYQVLKGNVAKRPQSSQGHMLIIANAPIPGQDSIGEQLIQSYEDTLAGKGEDTDFLYDSLEAPANTPIDREILQEVVSVVRGDSYWLDPESVVNDFFDPLVPITEARRKWLNQRTADSDSIYSRAQIAAAAREAQLRPGDEIVLGFDGGRTNDATALVAIRVKDRVIIPIRVWEKPREVDEWVVPHDQVESAVHDTFSRYKVRAFFADVNLWESFILSWSADYGEQLQVRASGESAIGWDMRGVRKATLAHERLVDGLQSGKVFHNGDPILVQHISNARKRYNVHGLSFGKESRDSSRKVDAYAATVLAYEALTVYLDRGRKAEKPARTGRVLMY